MGMLPDGNLYVLLTNTTREGAVIVQDRFERRVALTTEYVEMMSVCAENEAVCFLLIINLIVVVFYLIWNYIMKRKNRKCMDERQLLDAFMSSDRSCI